VIVGEHARGFGRGRCLYDHWHYVPVLARKPGALRNGAPFKGEGLPAIGPRAARTVLPANLEQIRRKLKGSNDGDRQMVAILSAVLDLRPGERRSCLCRGARPRCSLGRCRPQHPGAQTRSRAGGNHPHP
jgi:hypothetical protein